MENHWLQDFKRAKKELDLCRVYLYTNLDYAIGTGKPIGLESQWNYEEFGGMEPTVHGIMICFFSEVIYRQPLMSPLVFSEGVSIILDMKNITINNKWKIGDFYVQ